MRNPCLPRSFYDRPVLEVARRLLGATLVRTLPSRGVRLTGRIVEVEAYDGDRDLACHASKGRTLRTDPMFGEAGHAYVYLIYGMYACLNVVTGPEGYAAAVLIRGVEPLEGVEAMLAAARRPIPAREGAGRPARVRSAPRSRPPEGLAAGPGRLTRAFSIDLSLNRIDLCLPGGLCIEPGEEVPDRLVRRGPRIGVEYAGRWATRPWRFGIAGSAGVSRPFKPATGRTARGPGR